MSRPTIGGVIFDLDDTLFDCTGLLTEPARRRAATVLARSGHLAEADAFHMQVEWSAKLGSTEALREIARLHGFADDVLNEALATYNTPDVPPIAPFPDAVSTLLALKDNGLPLTLVTSGVPERQRAKIERLGLAEFFSKDIGNLFLHDPTAEQQGKGPHLSAAATWMVVTNDRTAVVGDKLDSEIEAGNRLGMVTIHIRLGLPAAPTTPEQKPDYEIDGLAELVDLLSS